MKSPSSAKPADLTAAIRAQLPVVAVLGGKRLAAQIETAVTEFADAPVTFVRVCNPLVSPLSLERLVLQITRDEPDEFSDDASGRVLRALIARSDMQEHVVVVVEQAETLTDEALEFLHGLPKLSDPGLAPVQVVLAGTPAFRERIVDDRTYIVPSHAIPAPATDDEMSMFAPEATWPPDDESERPRSKIPLVAGLGLSGILVLLFLVYGPFQANTISVSPTPPSAPMPAQAQTATPTTADEPPQTPTATSQAVPAAPQTAPAPAQAVPAAPPNEPPKQEPVEAPPATPPVQPADLPGPDVPLPKLSPPPEDAATTRARLYREFTAFLDNRGLGKRMPQAEREALFQEYLARRQAPPSSPQSATPAQVEEARALGKVRVLLLFASDSSSDRAAAEHQAELLRDRVAGLDLQPVPAVPTKPTIRYFYPADRATAFALAQTTPLENGEWLIESMTASQTGSQPGTVEMWLPRL